MGYQLPDSTEIAWSVQIGRREDTSADVYDNAVYDTASYDGGTEVGFRQLPESLVLSMRVKQGKDRFGKRYRAGTAQLLVDNTTGEFTEIDGLAQPGDYIYIRGFVQFPAGPPDVPIPDGWTWNDETGRAWTAHGNLVWADDTPDAPVIYPQFYGRIDNGIDTVRGGRSVTKLSAYDVFAELAPIDKDAVPATGAGESSFARVQRIAANASSAVSSVLTVGTAEATMQATTLAQGALDMMHLTMESEGGDLISGVEPPTDASGKSQIIAYGRDWLTTQPRSINIQWVLGGTQGLIITDANVSREQQLIVNDATFAVVGGVAQNSTDSPSIQRYGIRTTRRLDLIAEGDTQPQFLANRMVTNLKDLRPRIRQVTVPVLDQFSAQLAGNVQFGDLVLTTVQSVNGWSYTALGHVIGKRQQVFEKQWHMVLVLSDAFVDNVDGAFNEEMFSNAFTLGVQP